MQQKRLIRRKRLWANMFWIQALLCVHTAQGQSVCSSDGQATPTSLFERFVSADCGTCWSDPETPVGPPSALALDWIVPGDQREDAPLAAAASRDALMRLNTLQLVRPPTQMSTETVVVPWPHANLRVAHGVAVGDYVGASMELTLPKDALPEPPLQAWLLLVETLPPGLEHSPVSRNLVRNVFQPLWNKRSMLSNSDNVSYSEARPMNIPDGVTHQRLRVVGWVQDARGQVFGAAQSICPLAD